MKMIKKCSQFVRRLSIELYRSIQIQLRYSELINSFPIIYSVNRNYCNQKRLVSDAKQRLICFTAMFPYSARPHRIAIMTFLFCKNFNLILQFPLIMKKYVSRPYLCKVLVILCPSCLKNKCSFSSLNCLMHFYSQIFDAYGFFIVTSK